MRRITLIADIHGNAVALEAVLADIDRRGTDEIVCLGDVAAGAPQPREALERLRALGCAVVRGNTDDWLLGRMPAEDDADGRRLCATWLLGEGTVSLVASDAHGAGRLPVLDVAREAIAQRLGADVADPLFDGRALQLGYD